MEILIYGYGKRVEEVILPAAKQVFSRIYISGRNEKKIKKLAETFSCDIIKESEYHLLKNLSHIYVGTPNNVFIPIIEKLKSFFDRDINLFLETPIIGPISNYKILKYKKYFKRISVAEDYIFSPILDILSKLKKNADIKKIDYINSGYHIHSLAVGFKLSNSKKIIFSNKYNENFYFKLYDLSIKILNFNNTEPAIVFSTLNEKITFFHLSELGKINVEIDGKNSRNKKIFSFSFNKLNLNIKDKESLLRIYSCINMFRNHENEILSLLDNNTYISLIVKFLSKFGFFFDLYFFRRSFINYLFKLMI
jgi:hypothetical protein